MWTVEVAAIYGVLARWIRCAAAPAAVRVRATQTMSQKRAIASANDTQATHQRVAGVQLLVEAGGAKHTRWATALVAEDTIVRLQIAEHGAGAAAH